jgi:hypothetical protein
VEVAELIRRHRFFGSMPLGGRLMALRWMLHAPDLALDPDSLVQRKEFFARHPDYLKLTNQSLELQKRLRALPIKPPANSSDETLQNELFLELFKAANAQEAYLLAVALRREPANFVFPPSGLFSDLKAKMSEDQVAVTSLATRRGYHQFVISQQNRQYLGLVAERDVRKQVAALIKSLGIRDTSGGVEIQTLESEEWRKDGFKLKQLLFPGVADDQWDQFKELIVVPDGLLWYVPWEILQTGTDASSWTNLSEKVDVRYSPTMFLALAPQRPAATNTRTIVVVDRVHPKGDPEMSIRAFEQLAGEITSAAQFDQPIKFPSNLLGAVVDQIVVWSDLEATADVYSLMPVQLDKGKQGSNLAGWLALPWDGPQMVIIPGYSSDAAGGVKSKSSGQELFLITTALLGSGVRNIVLSRWRVGGKNSLDLTRDYANFSRKMGAREAWKKTLENGRAAEISLATEPRVKATALDHPVTARHPFFWAAPMLIDVPQDQELVDQQAVDDPAPIDEPADVDAPKPADDQNKQGEVGQPGKKPDPPSDAKQDDDGNRLMVKIDTFERTMSNALEYALQTQSISAI